MTISEYCRAYKVQLCDCCEDMSCADNLNDRLKRIEDVYQKFKHLDKLIMDNRLVLQGENYKDFILRKLWQAIRRNENE